MSVIRVAYLLLACILVVVVNGQCPHTQSGLVNFSSLTGWNVLNNDMVITQPVKMNTSPPNKLRSITVKSGGSLIFDNVNLNVSLNFIRVESNASFIMGSSSCPITSKIVLTFYGSRVNNSVHDMGSDPFDGSNLGSKGIAFLSGSIVQIYGQVDSPSWTEIVKNATKETNQLQLKEAVQWKVGDSIVIASTDYSEVYSSSTLGKKPSLYWARGVPFPNQNEERKIVQLLNGNKTIVLDRALNYTHHASDDGMMRAEVGLLSRRIVFTGDDSSEKSLFGGHFIIRLVDKFHMQGAEITRFGQQGLMGRYSFHFHLLQNKPLGLNFTVKDNTVHHSYQRCYVVHDTNHVLVQNNVCYRAYGHMYFLEDGSETGNSFISNLGIDPIPIGDENANQIILSDSSVSVYWITNPNNTFIGNHACNGRFGFWFTLPTFPTGLSAYRYPPGSINPRTTPVKLFQDNVAHSAGENGLHIDDMENADGSSEPIPYQISEAAFSGFFAYKNRKYGVWARGGFFRFSNLYLSDNRFGMNAPGAPSIIYDSTIIGESSNTGDSSFRSEVDVGGRSRPNLSNSTVLDLIKGYETYDNGGPQYLRNVTFVNFISNSYRYAGALSQLNNNFKFQTKNRCSSLKFINANRFMVFPWNHPVLYDNHNGTALMDVDGSMTTISFINNEKFGGWITANVSTMLFPACQEKKDWNAYQCPFFGESYSQLRVQNPSLSTVNVTGSDGIQRPDYLLGGKQVTRMIMVDLLRDKQSEILGGYLADPDLLYLQSNIITRGFYSVRWPNDIPTHRELTIIHDSNAQTDWIVVTIQFPRGSTFNIKGPSGNLTRGSNLESVIQEPNSYYYFDESTEHLYLKLQSMNNYYKVIDTFVNYSPSTTFYLNAYCPNNNCAPSQFSNPPNARTIYKTLMREDRFVGRFRICQQVHETEIAENSTIGYGNVFAFLDRKTASLTFTVQHNLSSIATSLDIGFGAPRRVLYMATPTSTIVPFSQSRFVYMLSYDEWNNLLQGKMFLRLSTKENPNGHLRSQVYINNGTATSCSLPPQVSATKPCDPLNLVNPAHLITIYDEAASFSTEWSASYTSVADERTAFVNSNYTSAICGSSSLHFGVKDGSLQISRLSSTKIYVNTTIYQYFEFFIRTVNGTASLESMDIQFVYLTSQGKEKYLTKYTTQLENIQHFKIDHNRATRVRIPVSELGFSSNQYVHKVILSPDSEDFIEFLLDNMRFVGASSEEEDYEQPMESSLCKYYGTSAAYACQSANNPDPDPLGIRLL